MCDTMPPPHDTKTHVKPSNLIAAMLRPSDLYSIPTNEPSGVIISAVPVLSGAITF